MIVCSQVMGDDLNLMPATKYSTFVLPPKVHWLHVVVLMKDQVVDKEVLGLFELFPC